MRTLSLLLSSCAVLAAQTSPAFTNQQQTTGAIGIVAGQTARLNVVYPTAPAPILQVLCSVTLAISDASGNVLKSKDVPQLIAGKSVSLDLNADTDLTGPGRTQIFGFSIAPNGCRLPTSLEIFDNTTQKTLVVVRGEPSYPITAVQSADRTPRN
jgi:hypothetical protein